MNGEAAKPHHDAVETIFDAAIALPPAERAAFLADACGVDLHLRQRVEALLRAHDANESILPDQPDARLTIQPAGGEDPNSTLPAPQLEQVGERVGRYRLLQQIGEGGCGVVYLAEQLEPVKRRVALKVIKPGMDSRQVLARVEAERQELAL